MRRNRGSLPVLVVLVAWVAGGLAAVAAPPAAAEPLQAAAAAYAKAFNDRDFTALAEQWTTNAELVEGDARFRGRDAIVKSLRRWLDRHPQATLAIDVTGVEMLAAPLARVSGVMRFTREPGAKEVTSRFASLRALEEGSWRLVESVVTPSHAAALDDLDWLIGTWRADAGPRGGAVEVTFEKPLGGFCILGRTRVEQPQGAVREAIQVIHADRRTGLVRTWVFDSAGARAEGVVEFDGTSYHQTMVGTPAETASGREARWVQVISPTGAGRFTLHAIERSIDGMPVTDGRPVHFRKVP
jgi:ketosteroid isomerase-like protein